MVLRCLSVARKDNSTGFPTGLTCRSKNLDPTGRSTRPVSISAPKCAVAPGLSRVIYSNDPNCHKIKLKTFLVSFTNTAQNATNFAKDLFFFSPLIQYSTCGELRKVSSHSQTLRTSLNTLHCAMRKTNLFESPIMLKKGETCI